MRIEFIDTTLRDGQQSPLLFDSKKFSFNLDERKLIIKNLIEIGVRYFELFSPIVSDAEKEIIPILMKYGKAINPDVKFLAHCRCHESDIENSLKAGFDGLNLYLGTSSFSQQFNHGKNLEEIIRISGQIIADLRTKHPDLHIRFSGEDSFRTPLADLFKVYDPLYELVDVFGMPDTVGIATPETVTERVTEMKKRYPNVGLEGHFHNDRGLAIINALTAVKAGMNYIDTSIWGLAERSGINSISALLMNLNIENPDYVKGYDISQAYSLNVVMGSVLGLQVPHLEPVSLTNRTHIAGVHQKGMMSNSNVYEAHNLENYGVNTNSMLLGPLSGSNLIHYYINEILSFESDIESSKSISSQFKNYSKELRAGEKPEVILETLCTNAGLKKRNLSEESPFHRVENLS